ncbi:MAG: aminopeptidase [Flavobacteriaceae bacterium]|nr:MAG: aminopeptidase [Flavobacteriaceae bacterium]
MKKIFIAAILAFSTGLFAQEDTTTTVNIPSAEKYHFTTIVDIEASEVKSQGNTGTCWSYSTSSFIESEIFRNTGKHIDISEMYNVRNTYPKKAWNYVMRQGKIQFSEGGLAHDVIQSVQSYGLVPESAYTGLLNGATKHDHSKIVPKLKKVLDIYIKNDKNSSIPNWKVAVDSILDASLGKITHNFFFEGVMYTPESFLALTKIKATDYITLTSFTHQPYNTPFVLNIPDNFSNGIFYNVELNSLVDVMNNALKKGYSIALDCDVSEKTFSGKYGIAVSPNDVLDNKKALEYIVEEKDITEDFRQAEYENYNTTDDHLMHVTGMLKDQKGTIYYKVKNSWGPDSKRIGNGGYIYMSEAYFRFKTISILLHKDGLPKKLKKKLNIS